VRPRRGKEASSAFQSKSSSAAVVSKVKSRVPDTDALARKTPRWLAGHKIMLTCVRNEKKRKKRKKKRKNKKKEKNSSPMMFLEASVGPQARVDALSIAASSILFFQLL
jgi:hypothetical protein